MVTVLPQEIYCLQKAPPWKSRNNPILLVFRIHTKTGIWSVHKHHKGLLYLSFLPTLWFFTSVALTALH